MRPCAARRVRSLHRRSEGRRTRAVPGPLRLSPHPCGSPLYATIALTLLKGAVGVACWFVGGSKSQSKFSIFQATRNPFPVRRPSGGVAQGDARQDAERGTKGQGRPFVTCPRSGT